MTNKFQQWSLFTLYNGEMARGGRYVRRSLGIEWILHLPTGYRHHFVDYLNGTNLSVRDYLTLYVHNCINLFYFMYCSYARMKDEESFIALFVDVVLGIWMLAMSILSAIFITLGFIVWCDGMTERFPSCETSAGQNIIRGDTEKINNSGFYIEMGTTQVSGI